MDATLFYAAKIKLRRARKHIADVEPEFDRLLARHDDNMSAFSIAVEMDFLPEHSMPTQAMAEVACCTGDAVHNLRSALDLLACEAVERSGGSPKDVHFPFAQTAAELPVMIRGKKFNRASDDAQRLLVSLEPHGEPHGNALLWGIHRLDLIDKHQDVLALAHDIPNPALYMDGVRVGEPSSRLVFAPASLFADEEVVAVLDRLAGETERVIKAFGDLFR